MNYSVYLSGEVFDPFLSWAHFIYVIDCCNEYKDNMFIMKRMDVMGKMLREEIIRLPNISNMSVDIVIQ